jgi:demethylmenaquinone methyltransferase/2-methoxy-6-polyprenyl-1,4-benzoquinol methylase
VDEMQAGRLFDGIAPRYDFLNHLLSLGLDRGWRKRAIRALTLSKPERILDVATGSGDLAIAALDVNPGQITAIDVSEKMLAAAAAKIKRKKAVHKIILQQADVGALPFADGSFDAAIAGFGVRNFFDLEKGLGEMQRVLKSGGVLVVLEFSCPRHFPLRQLHRFYLRYVIPLAGGLVSGKRAAYIHLGTSILAFPHGAEFAAILARRGFSRVSCHPLHFGICSIYRAEKK